jgi:hypothetical protein
LIVVIVVRTEDEALECVVLNDISNVVKQGLYQVFKQTRAMLCCLRSGPKKPVVISSQARLCGAARKKVISHVPAASKAEHAEKFHKLP